MTEEKKEDNKNKKEEKSQDANVGSLEVKIDEKKKNEVSESDIAPQKKKKSKKIKRQIAKGKATVKCTYNNTIVSITDLGGNVLAWCSSGALGFKGAKKATPYAATQVVSTVTEKVKKYGIEELEVYVKGVGSGRESSIRALANKGFNLVLIKDRTPIPHNGCRPRRPRRI